MAGSRRSAETREVELEQGVVRYQEVGEGPVLVFVHGLLVNGALWRKVVPLLGQHYRCIVPDLPLGSHRIPLNPDVNSGPGVAAQIIADLLEALDLRDVTLVGNDTGGAICQIVAASHPGRLSRLVLTNCDAYEAFFPLLLKPLHYGAKFLGQRFTDVLAWALRARFAQRVLLWTVAESKMDPATLDAYLGPLIQSPEVRRDLTKFLSRVSNRYTLDAARTFRNFDSPVLIAWGENDMFFSSKLARRLEKDFPSANLEFIPNSRAFVPEDQPERLVGLIQNFMKEYPTGDRG